MPQDPFQHLNQYRAAVEERLRTYLRPADGVPAGLREAMLYSLMAPGKRLRPILVVLAAEAAGGAAVAALPAACAVEMVHTYSLIHDDLPAMDDDDLRRGLPTCHKKFGEALAILAGDALLTLAFQVLAEEYPPATASGCILALARGAGMTGMVGGQVLDLAWERGSGGLEDLENIHARKTGALFRACLRIGAWTAQGERPGGPDPDLLDRLDAFGRCFGQAFQITDDLLDVEGDAVQTGKRVGKDAARGKLTYPGVLGRAESRRRADELCRQACELLEPLGPAGQPLAELACLIRQRNH
ncbi:MAG: polyprenyl synthetase family protein [Gemmataceae bacterium]|nr:polyprenyl synthetase family protein [Gemmataceae bacterium]MDW8265087.1 polyprenyl synthetase family protein [Gemmataceae bacterium]